MNLYLLQPGDSNFLGAIQGMTQGGNIGERLSAVWQGALPMPMTNGPYIELHSWRQEISPSNSGKPPLSPITFSKPVDTISARLYDCCLRAIPLGKGARQPTLLWIGSKAADNSANLMCLMLRDALVADVQLQASPDSPLTEQVQLGFSEIVWNVFAQDTKGASHGKLTIGWSTLINKPIAQFTD